MLTLRCRYRLLQFRFEAGTSRGVMRERPVWFVIITDEQTGLQGIGEAAPLSGLSPDFRTDYEVHIEALAEKFRAEQFQNAAQITQTWIEQHTQGLPALRFALETAAADLQNGGKRLIYDNPFFQSRMKIPINGLIWMGSESFMMQQVEEKLAAGFSCLKMKVGAIDFDKEINILKSIRQRFSPEEITLRVDANGAFTPAEAPEKLAALAAVAVHSIEQPIRPKQWEVMAALCKSSPLPVALDEELIGIETTDDRIRLLEMLCPPYIILKPGLLGGLAATAEWIRLAEERNVGWWITSALESNIGLNAICQLTACYNPTIPQGLGTGQLYYNNIESPLLVSRGYISYNPEGKWGQVSD